MKKIVKVASFLLLSLLVLSGCQLLPKEENNTDDNLYVLTEIPSNRGNTGYKKGDVVSYSIDLNTELVYANEFREDGVESELKENNIYDLESLEDSEETLSFSFDNRKEILLKNSSSIYESEITGMQYQFKKNIRY